MTEVLAGIKLVLREGIGPNVAAIRKSLTSAFSRMGRAVTGLNQGLMLFKKLGHGLQMLFSGVMTPQLDRFGRSVGTLRDSVAGLLLPTLSAFAKALDPVIERLVGFLNTNRELIATRILEWAVSAGRGLISGLAAAANVVVKAISGLRMAWHTAAGFGARVGKVLSRLTGQHMLYSRALNESADQSDAAAAKALADMQAWEKGIDGLHDQASGFLYDVQRFGVEFSKAGVKAKTGFFDKLLELSKKQLAEAAGHLAAYFRNSADYYNRVADLAEKTAKAQQEREDEVAKDREEKMRSLEERNRRIADGLTGLFFDIGAAVAKGGKDVGDAIGSIFAELGLQIAKLVASKAFMFLLQLLTGGIGGVFGEFFSFIFGGADGGLVQMAGGGMVQRYAGGGPVQGGFPGRDSVPALLMPDEYVIPAHQVRQNVAAGRAPDDSGSAGGGGSLSLHMPMLIPPTQPHVVDMIDRGVRAGIQHMQRTGKMRLITGRRS